MMLKPSKRTRLLAAIPVDRICRACSKPQLDVTQWRLTAFGDAVCLTCYKLDRLNNQDIYADPVLRREIWQQALQQVKRERAKISRSKDLTPGTRCARCNRVYSIRNTRQEWVYSRNTWLCRKCFYDSSHLQPGQFCEDRHGRVFLVTDYLRAQYPFGIARIPRGVHCELANHAQAACSLIYEQQRATMWELVAKHLKFIDKLTTQISQKYKLEDTLCHDLIMQAAMRAATLYNSSKQTYASLLVKSAYNAVNNYQVREQKKAIVAVLDTLPEYAQQEYNAEQEQRIDKFFQAVTNYVSAEDWYIFTTWVLGNRSQAQIGADLGVISQAVSMRITKVKETCRKLAYILLDRG